MRTDEMWLGERSAKKLKLLYMKQRRGKIGGVKSYKEKGSENQKDENIGRKYKWNVTRLRKQKIDLNWWGKENIIKRK